MPDWRVNVLQGLGAPVTPQNLSFLTSWQRWEGGHTANDARFNWLNTTSGNQFPSINPVGVRSFPDFRTGVRFTLATLRNGRYADIVQGLKSGDPYAAKPVAGLSTWVSGSPTGNLAYAQKVLGLQPDVPAPASLTGKPTTAKTTTSKPLFKPTNEFERRVLQALAGKQQPVQKQRPLFQPTNDFERRVLQALGRAGTVGKPKAILQGPQGEIPVVADGRITPRLKKVLAEAQNYLGTPYVWGGANPGGFDCSGLVKYLYAKIGVELPHYTISQWQMGTKIENAKDLQPGDAVFFNWGRHPTTGEEGPQHMGLYLGGGKFLQAPRTGDVVKISNMSERDDFLGGRRFV